MAGRWSLLTGMLAAASAWHVPASGDLPIRVHEEFYACMVTPGHTDTEWAPADGGYRRGDRFLSRADVAAMRATILGAKPEPAPDLLAQVGVTPATLAAHRNEILETAWPDAFRPEDGAPLELPEELEPLLRFESIGPHILDELLSRNWSSTTQATIRIELPGDPTLTLKSGGLVPWKLPWTVRAGAKEWTSADLDLSRLALRLASPSGPNAELLDGREYWAGPFWRSSFWSRWVGEPLNSSLCLQRASKLQSYSEAMTRFRVEEVRSDPEPRSLFFRLATQKPAPIDGVWWWAPLEPGTQQPTKTWQDLLRAFDAATRCAEAHPWLHDWKAMSERRTIEIHVVGDRVYAETQRGTFVLPPWQDAGFLDEPEFELWLRRGDDWCGTVWLSSAEPGALIEAATPGSKRHWFDQLDFSYHPLMPTYGRVDAFGRCEVRTIRK